MKGYASFVSDLTKNNINVCEKKLSCREKFVLILMNAKNKYILVLNTLSAKILVAVILVAVPKEVVF